MKLEQTLTPCTKLNSKWLKDLNIRQDTIKLLKENIDKTFSDINLTNVFSGQPPKETEIRGKNKPMGPNQTEMLLHSKGNQKENKNRSSCCGAVETNPTRNHEVVGSIAGLAQWVKDLVLL